MPYKFTQTSPGNVEVTNNLESFWFIYSFDVDKSSKKVNITNGYFAAYIAQKSGKPVIKSLYADSNVKKDDKIRKLEISNTGSDKIKISNATLVNSRFSQFSNQVCHLHLFHFTSQDEKKSEDKKDWIDTKGWSAKFKNPEQNDDGKYFLKQTLSIDKVKDRCIYWLASQFTDKGTERIVLTVPFMNNSLTGTILSKHNENFPKVEMSLDENTWSFPKGSDELPGAIKGFVMVAEGAFKAIPLTSEIDKLLELLSPQENPQNTPSHEDVMNYLYQKIHEYPTPIVRTLNTANVTKSTSIVQSSPELPIEVFYISGLNSTNPVDPTVKN